MLLATVIFFPIHPQFRNIIFDEPNAIKLQGNSHMSDFLERIIDIPKMDLRQTSNFKVASSEQMKRFAELFLCYVQNDVERQKFD